MQTNFLCADSFAQGVTENCPTSERHSRSRTAGTTEYDPHQIEKKENARHPSSFASQGTHSPPPRQLRVVEGVTGFSNMSFPCFSTKALALLASSDSNQGS